MVNKIRTEDAMYWNACVERRRREYHERRCAEDPIYKRAYERHLEMAQRIQKMQSVAMAHLQNATGEAENAKCQQATDLTSETDRPQSPKSHEEAMRERAMLEDLRDRQLRECGLPTSPGALAILMTDPVIELRLKEFGEEIPYAEEIRRKDREFDGELVRISGFEW